VIRKKEKGVVRNEGYTDSKGSDAYNQRLSERRANAVHADPAPARGCYVETIQCLGAKEAKMKQLQRAKINEFKSYLRGNVLLPGDAGYDEVRQIWNAMISRRPALIARCASPQDVVQAVKFAREQNLLVSIRGGGHNIAGNAVCDDGLMIDLSLMKSVQVDPNARRAAVDPGCTLADFDAAAQAHGLATPLGINSTTGVAGLTLGGGFGWLSRKHGMTIDNLLSADVVTADGSQVRASETENADLFWGLRGGGGNFGIVTRFEFQLHPVGPNVLSGLIAFPFDQAKSVLTRFARFTETMPDELNVWMVTRKAPPLPFLPQHVHGKEIVALAVCYAGDPAEGEKLIEPLRGFGAAHGEHIGVQPYTAWQQAFDPLLARGARNYWKSHNFSRLSDGAIDTIIEYARTLPSPHCEIFIGTIGGQTARVAPEAMAYSSRDANYVMNVHGRWESAAEDQRCIGWARAFFSKSKPFASSGAYINFLTQEETDRIASAYGATYNRLVELKKKYDPTNFFQMNQNIKPV
jgi:FAD/FMN-containing dehydrogenase